MKLITRLVLLPLILIANGIYAQSFTFTLSDSIEIKEEGKDYINAWAGGLNAAQISKIDLNNDGVEDILVYDRTTYKLSTFLNENDTLKYAPYIESQFPSLNYWVLLKDFDGDGLKDLFTGASSGITVYKNKGFSNRKIEWELFKDVVRTLGFSGTQINLKVDITDIPAIVDVDGDGDLDIFNFVPSFGGSIQFHQNLSMETYGTADSLVYEKITDTWGALYECGNCLDYFFDGGSSCRVAAIEHAGSALLLFDKDNDGDQDLYIGEVDCTNLVAVPNKGSAESVLFEDYDLGFPSDSPVDMIFPGSFYEDVDYDGKEDLIVSPNLFSNDLNEVDFSQSIWFYKNTGTDTAEFTLVKQNFLQDNMLDLGEGTSPAVADEDGDGDLDLFVANKGRMNNGNFYATLFFYENTGTNEQPVFELKDEDYLGLSKFSYTELKIQFADIDGDGLQDLAYTAYQTGTSLSVRYMLNRAASESEPLDYSTNQIVKLGFTVNRLDEVHFVDVDKDGEMDILLGKFQGGVLSYYRNSGDLVFEDPIDGFGGITYNNLRRELSLETADLDGDGNLELITGDRSGELRIYPNFQNELETTFTTLEDTIYDSSNKEYVEYYFGTGIYPVVFGKDIILGTEAGGLRYLRSTKVEDDGVVSAIDDELDDDGIVVFPNPALGSFSISSTVNGFLNIYANDGKLILEDLEINANEDKIIKVSSWPEGLYILRILSNHAVSTKKLLIKK